MKRPSNFFANLYATVFVVVFCALVGGGFMAVESTGFFRGARASPQQLDASDYRARAKKAFVVGAVAGGVFGVLIQLWRPRKPARFDDYGD